MIVTVDIELTEREAYLLSISEDEWTDSRSGNELPRWAYHYIPVMQGYDFMCRLSDLGKQVRAKLVGGKK